MQEGGGDGEVARVDEVSLDRLRMYRCLTLWRSLGESAFADAELLSPAGPQNFHSV